MEMSEEASATTQRVKGAWTRAGAVGVGEVVCFQIYFKSRAEQIFSVREREGTIMTADVLARAGKWSVNL